MTNPARTTAHLIALLVALLGMAAEPALAEPETISKSELRTAPPVETHRALRDVFWDMIELDDHRRDIEPRRALTDVWLETRPLPTRVPGLCRYDVLKLEFERVDGEYDTPGAQARPVGVEATSFFAFHEPPAGSFSEIVEYEGLIRDECAGVEKDGAFFSASGVESATNGYLALAGTRRKARSEAEGWLDCDLLPSDTFTCAELIASLGPDKLDSIDKCQAEEDLACHELWFGNRRLRVYSPFGFPAAAEKARLDSLILMSHERID